MRLHILVLALVSVVSVAGCKKLPGGGKVPGGGDTKLPGGGIPAGLPGGAPSEVNPNACGAAFSGGGDAGRKFKLFLEATKTLQTTTTETVKVVKESCLIMGKELGMLEADLGGEANEVCAKVWGVIDNNMKVSIKSKAALKVVLKPAVCKVDVSASASFAASCEGSASADVSATCSGMCSGKCDGKAGTGGAAVQCNGKCEGSCEGHADVKASAQCKAAAEVHASANLSCTPPEVTVTLDAKLVVDKTKAEATLKALKAGLPKIFDVKARLEPLGSAVKDWVSSVAGLKGAAAAFKSDVLCVGAQAAAVVKASTQIEANVSISVSVSANASGTVGG